MSLLASPTPKSGADAQGRRLESWKEIAAYLGRDVTTVRRWEKREGLPVHRLHHSRLGSVYAYSLELNAWRNQRAPRAAPAGTESNGVPQTVRRIWAITTFVALGLVVAGGFAWRSRQRSTEFAASANL